MQDTGQLLERPPVDRDTVIIDQTTQASMDTDTIATRHGSSHPTAPAPINDKNTSTTLNPMHLDGNGDDEIFEQSRDGIESGETFDKGLVTGGLDEDNDPVVFGEDEFHNCERLLVFIYDLMRVQGMTDGQQIARVKAILLFVRDNCQDSIILIFVSTALFALLDIPHTGYVSFKSHQDHRLADKMQPPRPSHVIKAEFNHDVGNLIECIKIHGYGKRGLRLLFARIRKYDPYMGYLVLEGNISVFRAASPCDPWQTYLLQGRIAIMRASQDAPFYEDQNHQMFDITDTDDPSAPIVQARIDAYLREMDNQSTTMRTRYKRSNNAECFRPMWSQAEYVLAALNAEEEQEGIGAAKKQAFALFDKRTTKLTLLVGNILDLVHHTQSFTDDPTLFDSEMFPYAVLLCTELAIVAEYFRGYLTTHSKSPTERSQIYRKANDLVGSLHKLIGFSQCRITHADDGVFARLKIVTRAWQFIRTAATITPLSIKTPRDVTSRRGKEPGSMQNTTAPPKKPTTKSSGFFQKGKSGNNRPPGSGKIIEDPPDTRRTHVDENDGDQSQVPPAAGGKYGKTEYIDHPEAVAKYSGNNQWLERAPAKQIGNFLYASASLIRKNRGNYNILINFMVACFDRLLDILKEEAPFEYNKEYGSQMHLLSTSGRMHMWCQQRNYHLRSDDDIEIK